MSQATLASFQAQMCRKKLDSLWNLVEETKLNPQPDDLESVKVRVEGLPRLVNDYESSLLTMMAHEDNATKRDDLWVDLELFNEDVTRVKVICKKSPFTIPQVNPDHTLLLNTAFSANQTSVNSSTFARLPKLNLPPFHGDIAGWQSFFDIFCSSIHDNESLTPVQKFQYLRTCLRNQALALIQNLKLTDANYEIALSILKERYQRNRLISTLHVQGIVNLPPLKDTSYNSVNLFVSTIKEHISALRALNEPVDQWGKILTVILTGKLEPSIRTRFEGKLDNNELPELDTLLIFVEQFISSQQWQTLEPARSTHSKPNVTNRVRSSPKTPTRKNTYLTTSTSLNNKCLACKAQHSIYSCSKFKDLSTWERFDLIKLNNHCYNCLAPQHQTKDCKSKTSCKICHQRHHTLLHFDKTRQSRGASNSRPISPKPSGSNSQPSGPSPQVLITTNVKPHNHSRVSRVLLSTALILVKDSHNRWKSVRVLLDSGSETSLITESCRRRLNLNWSPTNLTISGISSVAVNTVKGRVTCCFRPRHLQHQFTVTALVVKSITASLPNESFESFKTSALDNLVLADPNYFESGPIDMLLGADIYFSLVEGKTTKLPEGPYAVETALGVVLSGPIARPATHLNSFHTSVDQELGKTLRRFWELEEVPHKSVQSEEEAKAELLFAEQHKRTADGRYIVPLLFKSDVVELGGSYGPALACYRSLRTRLNNNPALREEYLKFMRDYLDSGHMSKLDFEPFKGENGYYIPHHCVAKHDGLKMKLRVVFNASKPSSNGVSLNDTLLPGPPLQIDLAQVVMRQRLYPVILTADIRQMFRQVLIPTNQRQYQKILWDFDLSTNPKVFQLNTVTYGTTCAPYLAIKTLHQLAQDEGDKFPLAAYTLKHDTFVDDIITGADNLENALVLKSQLCSLLAKAGMELRKWASNDNEVLEGIPEDHKLVGSIDLDRDNTIKILGLRWNPSKDSFMYLINLPNATNSKRQLLSEAARIFDPLGWLSPITIVAKLLIQELWKLGLGWDDPLPTPIADKWLNFKSQLPCVSDISIPRWILNVEVTVDLVGFCDASEKGYAAVVYIRSAVNSEVNLSLVMAKTKVAPVKQVSLPRLELCAALLLAQVIDCVRSTLDITFNRTFLWTDSTVTLSWIQSPAHRWKTFVANRVSQIAQLSQISDWYHVRSFDNPADCASRGLMPNELRPHPLWWSGPSWLSLPYNNWPLNQEPHSNLFEDMVIAETKPPACFTLEVKEENEIFTLYSSYNKLRRITSLCLRFSHNCKRQTDKKLGFITVAELHEANLRLTKLAQSEVYSDEMEKLKTGSTIGKSLRKLDPFLDSYELLRVGGRLRFAQRTFHRNHPLLLPAKHTFTEMIVKYYHEKYLHASPRNVQAIIERTFWIIGARTLIRHICSKCVICFRNKPTLRSPMMGDLPHQRISPQKPFAVVGTDYGGPFLTTPCKGRGYKTHKSYLCLFVCFVTKAVHLELASDLSTEQFLNAFRRFISRRGRCSHIYSDGGTNFVGAKAHFTDLQKFISSTNYNEYLANKLTADGIEWHINPPSAPHFGGLWEAAIKSVKHHLSRVIGQQIMTFEEMCTLTCQIEAILNSRPLTPLSTDPEDCDALTPSHFLTMEPAASLPEPSLEQETLDQLSRWKLIQRISQDFWNRWSDEYLNTLQQRHKWNQPTTQLQLGQLVLIKDNCLPPLQWKLGRVLEVFPGRDNVVRVASVKTARGTLLRPVVKLAPLPINPEPSNG